MRPRNRFVVLRGTPGNEELGQGSNLKSVRAPRSTFVSRPSPLTGARFGARRRELASDAANPGRKEPPNGLGASSFSITLTLQTDVWSSRPDITVFGRPRQ